MPPKTSAARTSDRSTPRSDGVSEVDVDLPDRPVEPERAGPVDRADRPEGTRSDRPRPPVPARCAARPGAGRTPRSRAARESDRSPCSSPTPMQTGIARSSSRRAGRKPSPRFASVVGQAHTVDPPAASRSSSWSVTWVACTIVVRSVKMPDVGQQLDRPHAVLGQALVDLARAARWRGCAPPCRWSCAYAAISSSQSRGSARTLCGARPTAALGGELLHPRQVVGDRGVAEPPLPLGGRLPGARAGVGAHQQHDLDAGVAGGGNAGLGHRVAVGVGRPARTGGAGSGTRRPPCTRRPPSRRRGGSATG